MNNHRTWVEINEQALIENLNSVRSLLSEGSRLCAVIKSNAYGHGMKEVVRIHGRHGVDAFALDSIDNAIELRHMFPSALILVIGYVPNDRFEETIENGIEITVSDKNAIDEIEKVAARRAKMAKIHLEIDTGMSRLGIQSEFLKDFLNQILESKHVTLSGISTHFSETDNQEFTGIQFQKFQEAVMETRQAGLNPPYVHCAKSGAVILYPDTHGTLCRPGIILYGLWPSEETENTARKLNIKFALAPVLEWKTTVSEIKTIDSGTSVGYGMTETVQKPTRIAILSVGYYDGYDRRLSNRSHVLINGIRCKILGRVCMNMIIVDVSKVANVQIGQEAILIGKSGGSAITAKELAEIAGTIDYEIVTRINEKIPRIVV